MPAFDLSKRIDIANLSKLFPIWFRECTPQILVVTDNLNYSPTSAFGLVAFVDTLRAATIHGMTPIVTTARFSPAGALSYDPAARHIENFKFSDPTHGVLKRRYDVVFLLGINTENGPKLTDEAGALDAMTAFMQAGGGVFATGDHEDLGAGLCMDLPRVRAMRHWRRNDTPSAGGPDRLTTNLAGAGDVYEFDDQADAFPQRLYVNYRSKAGGVGAAHPLLQVPGHARAIEVFPDHPHEGRCRVPSNLASTLPDGATPEWPPVGGADHAPEEVALTVSHGNQFPTKQAVVPTSFLAICAYDGHPASVGRVVTDATWHHFVNVNIVGNVPNPPPQRSGLTGRDLDDVKQYFRNLAIWLMPKNVRRCRRYVWVLEELIRYPLFEELRWAPLAELDGGRLREIGALVADALSRRATRATVLEIQRDALEDAIGAAAAARLEAIGTRLGSVSAADASLAALGALTMSVAATASELGDREKLDGEAAFDAPAREALKHGVRVYLEESRSTLKQVDEAIASVCA